MNKESPDDKYIRDMKTKARLFAQLMELWDRKCKDGTVEWVVKDWFDKQNFASTDEMDIGKSDIGKNTNKALKVKGET